MAKTKITDYSATRASNADIDGINIAEGCPAGNVNDALRELMVQLAETNAGTYPVADTLSFADPADLTKKTRIDAGGVTAGQNRVMTVPDRDINLGDITQPRTDIVAATTTDIGAVASQYIRTTGNATITSFGTANAGVVRDVLFGAPVTLTHNATSLILPGGVSFDAATGDTALLRSEGSGNWRVVRFQKASGKAVIVDSPTTSQVLTATSGASVGEVGTYALMMTPGNSSAYSPGQSFAGSFLRYTAALGTAGNTPSGTWELFGQIFATGGDPAATSLFLRVA